MDNMDHQKMRKSPSFQLPGVGGFSGRSRMPGALPGEGFVVHSSGRGSSWKTRATSDPTGTPQNTLS